jgi:hypothetical protein
MGIFFTWHSSEHKYHLDVKWNPQDEIRDAEVEDHSWLLIPTANRRCTHRTRANRLLGLRVAVDDRHRENSSQLATSGQCDHLATLCRHHRIGNENDGGRIFVRFAGSFDK